MLLNCHHSQDILFCEQGCTVLQWMAEIILQFSDDDAGVSDLQPL